MSDLFYKVKELADDFIDDLYQVSPSPDDWPRWILYALEGLENRTDPETYREILKSILAGIDSRLEFGRW